MHRHPIASIDELDLTLPGCVATLGVFDGLHLGHQTILDRVLAAARRRGLPSVCITFGVHPKAVLLGEAPGQIHSLEHRLELLEQAGLDHAIVVDFSKDFARLEPEAFVERLLVRQLGVRELVIGHDTAIGRHRRGDAQFLADAGQRFGFTTVAVGEVTVDGLPTSSTAVRRAIATGDLVSARRMLGRPVSLAGIVVNGDGRGASIGVPTANLAVEGEAFPPLGVYAVTVDGPGLHGAPAVMNYGLRPTFHQAADHAVFEVHVLDRDDLQLNGQPMVVALHSFLRREQRFDGPDQLVAQIRQDAQRARELLAPGAQA
ncbi:MAG: riboflavin biosynthesis protein RibF [Planctomycetota bacterium]|nr:MAG: riboflavin biosynthesis protein RibF [Planctomycetota bacterium]